MDHSSRCVGSYIERGGSDGPGWTVGVAAATAGRCCTQTRHVSAPSQVAWGCDAAINGATGHPPATHPPIFVIRRAGRAGGAGTRGWPQSSHSPPSRAVFGGSTACSGLSPRSHPPPPTLAAGAPPTTTPAAMAEAQRGTQAVKVIFGWPAVHAAAWAIVLAAALESRPAGHCAARRACGRAQKPRGSAADRQTGQALQQHHRAAAPRRRHGLLVLRRRALAARPARLRGPR